jgi:hypothetical protein
MKMSRIVLVQYSWVGMCGRFVLDTLTGEGITSENEEMSEDCAGAAVSWWGCVA